MQQRQRRDSLTKWLAALAAAAVVGLITWGLLVSRAGTPGATGSGSQMPPPDFYNLAGQPAPGFTLHDLTNTPVSLTQFRGKRLLLNFWYVACAPCRQEMPDLERFAAQNPQIVILGLNIEDDPATASQFLQQLGITYPVVLDSHQRVFDLYRLTSTPSSILIDSQGIIRGSVSGPLNTGQLHTYFQAMR
jgi:cytochrome c biogenesis protein CcmG/thiol:disulfide interchange protein DsbE